MLLSALGFLAPASLALEFFVLLELTDAAGVAVACGFTEGLPTVDLPTKMAPGSIESDAALMSPTSSALALSSTISVTSMLP